MHHASNPGRQRTTSTVPSGSTSELKMRQCCRERPLLRALQVLWVGLVLAGLGLLEVRGQTVLTNGLSVDGTISIAGTNTHGLMAAAGDRMVLQIAKLSGGAGFTPVIEAYTPEGARAAVRWDGTAARLDLQAASTGTYSVRVRDLNATGSGTYRLWFAQVPGPFEVAVGDDGGSMTNGARHQGNLEVGDLDLWTLEAGRGDRLAVQLAKVAGGAAFTPLLELFGPDGVRVAMDSGGVVARLDIQAALAGTYTVLVSDLNRTGAGSYELYPLQIPGGFTLPAGDEGGATLDGANQEGTIGLGDLDPWTFAAVAGDLVTVQLTELTGGAGFTPMLEVFTPTGERVRVGQGAPGATVDVAVEAAGTYTMLVSDASKTGTGTYRLSVSRGSIGAAAPNVLMNGASQLGSIGAAGESNAWSFTATVGENLTVRMGETATGAFVPWLRLYSPAGVLLTQNFNATAAEVSVRATNSGTFLAVVADGSASRAQTGNYRIGLAKTGGPLLTSPSDEGGALTNGASYLGTIDVGDVDAWSFTANAGDAIAIWMGETVSGATLLPWLRLYGPDGQLLAADYSAAAAEVTVRAANSGTFMAVLTDGNTGLGGVGNYRLSLATTGAPLAIAGSDEGGSLTNGLAYLGGLEVGDVDAWNFTANAGDAITLWTGESSSGTTLLPWLRLFGPDGQLLAQDYNAAAAEVTVRATNSGRFLAVVADGNSGRFGSGNYRLSLAKTGSPLLISPSDEGGPLVNGTAYLASLEVGDVDAWTLEAATGDSIVARMGESSTGTTLLPWLRLFGPDGVLLSSDYNAAAAEVAFRATNSGTFLVVASDGNSGRFGTGSYRLSVAKTGTPLSISPTDEGGVLTNGLSYVAALETGDIDAWTFAADVGENIVVRMGELSGGTLLPWLRLYGPNGAPLDADYNAAAAEVAFRATNSGVFTVVAADGNSGIGGAGNYRLSLAKAGTPLATSPGDEGGAMSGGGSYDGMIEVGDVDAWTFTACAGEAISLNVTELVAGSPLNPWIRLYGWNGELLRSSSGAASGVITNFVAPVSGTYTVVVGDGNSAIGGSGTYRLTVNDLVDELRFCPPAQSGTNVTLTVIGGASAAPFVLLSSGDVSAPLAEWTPILTDQFGLYGVVHFTNLYDPAEPQRYFLLRRP